MSWGKVNLGDLATFVNGYPFKPSDWSDEGMEIIRIQNLTKGSAETNYYKGQIPEKYKIKNGDILISWSATLDIFVWAGEEAWLNQHIFKVVFDKKEIDRNFFVYLIKFILDDMRKEVHGATMQHITKGKFDALQVPLPPLPIQKRIAEILDTADALRRKDQELLRKYDELAQAIFIDMFGDPVKNEKGWEVKKLEEVINFPSGLVDPRLNEYKDMYHVGGDNIDSKTGRIFGLKQAKELGLISGKFYFTSNHILYNKIRPYLNKVALPDFNGICSADMYPLLPKENEVLKEYLYFILRSPFFLDFADKQSRRANIPKINMTEMSLFELPVPPIEIQAKFISKLGGLNKNIDSVSACSDLSTNLFDSLLQQAFKGELVK